MIYVDDCLYFYYTVYRKSCILHFPAIFSMNFSPPPISPLAKYANSENIDSVLSPRHTGNATLRPGCNKCMFKFMDEVTSWLPV